MSTIEECNSNTNHVGVNMFVNQGTNYTFPI